MLSRREFVLLTPGATALASRHSIPVALQLFSVRKQCGANLADTLSRVARIGFAGIELAGYYGRTASEMRELIANNGLICCGAHVPFDSLTGDHLDATIQFQRQLGNTTLVVPGLPPRLTGGEAAWKRMAEAFTQISGRLRDEGMRLGYHNHAVEFQGAPGHRPFDVFFGDMPEDVFVELDMGNAGFGGADPVAAVRQYPGRTRMVHVKDYTRAEPDLIVGEGQMDWPRFIQACSDVGGTKWYVIEHDSNPTSNLADISECLLRFREQLVRP